MSGHEKSPSALDYGAHLHELALGSWTRAMLTDSPIRAIEHANRLTESPEKLWRFIGLHHAGLAHLGAGQVSAAVDALTAALRCYPSFTPITAAARRTAAHLHLETHSARRALQVLGETTPEHEDRGSRYFRALALARLNRHGAARELVGSLDADAASHIRSELRGEPHELDEAVIYRSFAPWHEAVPARAALAGKWIDAGRHEQAASVLESVIAVREAMPHWPIAYIRSLYRLASLDAASGRTDRAAKGFSRFQTLWQDAEIDRSEMKAAAQFESV